MAGEGGVSLGREDLERWEAVGFLKLASGLPLQELLELRSWFASHPRSSVAIPASAAAEDAIPAPLRAGGAVGYGARELLDSASLDLQAWLDVLEADAAGHSPRQDALALGESGGMGVLALDPLTSENGCPQLVPGGHRIALPRDPQGRLEPEIALSLTWSYQPLAPGELLWFRPGVPWRSGTNYTTRPRLALHLACVPVPALLLR